MKGRAESLSKRQLWRREMSLLEVKNLRVHFHDARPERWAVDGVSMSVERFNFLLIL